MTSFSSSMSFDAVTKQVPRAGGYMKTLVAAKGDKDPAAALVDKEVEPPRPPNRRELYKSFAMADQLKRAALEGKPAPAKPGPCQSVVDPIWSDEGTGGLPHPNFVMSDAVSTIISLATGNIPDNKLTNMAVATSYFLNTIRDENGDVPVNIRGVQGEMAKFLPAEALDLLT